MSLQTKLFAAFFTFIILPLFLLGIGAYHIVTNMIEEKYSQQAELTLRALSQSIGFVFGEMNKVTDSTIASDAIQDLLNDTNRDKDIHQIDYMELNEVQRNFRELLVNHPSVSFAFMYTLHNERINEIFTKGYFAVMPFDQFKQQPLYQKVLTRAGLPVWVGPYEYPELTGRDPVFTQIRVVKDIDRLDDKGILLVQIKNSGLESVFRYFRYKQETYNTQYLLVNSSGLILYDSAEKLNGSLLEEGHNQQFAFSTSVFSSDRTTINGQDSVVSSIGLGMEDWRLVSIASWDSLASEVLLYASWVAGIIALCLISAFVFIMFFANQFAGAIITTVKFMRRVERGDLSARLRVSGSDETALLSRGFNSLVGRVAELLEEVKLQQERKKMAELQALQAQIKPHFLFNALESINVLAVQNQGRKVSQMVARLGNILRISIQQQEEITIKQELEHLCSYLEIQKFRFEELFEFEIDVPEQLMNNKMPKLTLQPLVENSIQHGFEGIDYLGRLRISARQVGQRIVFTVWDNGIGIPADRLAQFEYQKGLGERRHLDIPATGERRGLGVCNVADRIRIGYGSGYGLLICSEAGVGTTIKLVIKASEMGSEQDAIEGAAR